MYDDISPVQLVIELINSIHSINARIDELELIEKRVLDSKEWITTRLFLLRETKLKLLESLVSILL